MYKGALDEGLLRPTFVHVCTVQCIACIMYIHVYVHIHIHIPRPTMYINKVRE